MTKPDDWYPHYIADYAADTMHLTTLQHGAYRLLMDAYWRNQGPLNDDDEALAAITRLPLKDWRKMRPTIGRFFQIDFVAATWTHKRIERELTRAWTNSENQSRAGRASAEARRQRKLNGGSTPVATEVSTEPQRSGQREAQQKANETATPHSSPNATPSGVASDAVPDDVRQLAKRAVDVLRKLQEICGVDENRKPAWARVDAVTGWLQAGADPDLDVFPAARAVMVREAAKGNGPPGAASYLTNAVMDAMRARLASGALPPSPSALVTDPEREAAAQRFNAAMDAWIAGGREGLKPVRANFLLPENPLAEALRLDGGYQPSASPVSAHQATQKPASEPTRRTA